MAVCRGEWEFRGSPLLSEDWYFFTHTDTFEPSANKWTDLERELHTGWKWWTIEDLQTASEVVFPAGLADLVLMLHTGQAPPEPIVLPWSSV